MKITRTNKVLLTLGSLGVAATIAGAGTFAAFTDTETATQNISAGTVILGSEAASFSTAITNVAPGDTIQKRFTLENDGSLDFSKIELVSVVLSDATSPTASGGDDDGTDLFDNLEVKVERCDAGWTGVAGSYTCTAGAVSVVANGTATSRTGDLTNVLLADGDVNDLVATYSLPAATGNESQNDGGTLTWNFEATQRTATNS